MARFSLRVRLLVLALLLVTTGLVVSDTLVLGTVRGQLVDRADEQLDRFAEPLSRRPPTRQTTSSVFSAQNVGRRSGQSLPSEYVVRYLAEDGSVLSVIRQPLSDSDPAPQLPALDRKGLTDRLDDPFTASGPKAGEWRSMVLPLQRATAGGDLAVPRYVQVAVPLADVESTISHLRTTFLTIGGAVLVGLAGLGALAVRAGLRPLRQLEAGAQRIADGDLSYRMPELPVRTEAGRLSAALNGMLTHIETAFAARAASEQRMRRFVADASHELRTPLAGIRGFAELHRMGALQDVDRAMDRIESEAVRLGALVEDLLMLARLDEERPLNLAPMDLRTLAADALHDLTALDPGRPVALTGPNGLGSPQAAPVLGDEARLRQVVTNLVGNAVKHTPSGTAVRIGVGRASGGCLLEVADQGPGLTQEQAALVFERFYRADAARTRLPGQSGGSGLGLAIASALVSAHDGELSLRTSPGEGAVFRLSLPLQR
ncbi:sensor histidine kinase [Kitasatospora cineracea]|uniref:histidine kinase n=1 Tax=Kitasatospora cineracea TaxID=88074 RepID=A0A3N4RL56_9ACTN|nr:HAMP domain-containing sensor histidine kinase [Kitasatospora cineracea]ROR43126.1 two-component system OmpR family sensor kinase [Kitasatospora cineracea]RPE33496.1 two-component system OmpR family sensor kinase [Kitasatospora cineracea]